MIITGIVLTVAAIMVANAGEKNLKLGEALDVAKDHMMGVQEDNRVLNTCLETMESEIGQQKKVINTKSEAVVTLCRMVEDSVAKIQQLEKQKTVDLKTIVPIDDSEGKRLSESMKSVVRERDNYKSLWDKAWDEKNAYKKMYEAELNKKAPQ